MPYLPKAVSRRNIVTGRKLDMDKDCRVLFGAYVDASKDAERKKYYGRADTQLYRAWAQWNLQGSVKCFDLLTGKLIIRRTVEAVPYPDRIIRPANSWGKQSQSKQFGNKLEFFNRNKVKYDWDNEEIEESKALVEPPSTAAHPGILAEIPGVELEADRNGTTTAVEAVPKPDLASAEPRSATEKKSRCG